MPVEARWSVHWRKLNHKPAALTKARLARNLSQTNLAAEVGVSRSYVCELEGGHRSANDALLTRLAGVLQCSMLSLKRRSPNLGGGLVDPHDSHRD
jgi:transcriptional regulator with XRE-family HTH domain